MRDTQPINRGKSKAQSYTDFYKSSSRAEPPSPGARSNVNEALRSRMGASKRTTPEDADDARTEALKRRLRMKRKG